MNNPVLIYLLFVVATMLGAMFGSFVILSKTNIGVALLWVLLWIIANEIVYERLGV